MSLSVAIQKDPIESVNIDADSSFVMALEAQARGHTLYHYLPHELSLRGNKVTARAHPLTVQRVAGNHFSKGEMEVIDLARIDVVLMRQDPPFDMGYITATHVLEHVHPKTLVVNDPAEVRNAPEKLFVTQFPDLMPDTLITSSRPEIEAFRAEHKDIIVKPLYGNGGAGVFHLKPDDENLGALLETFTLLYREPVIVQKYLPEIRQGDKRIILVEGEPVGAVSRIPQEGEARANFHAGGRHTGAKNL
ncbi:MAG: glutathione synthase, partial [Pseudomonadota bacterium]